MEPLRIFEDFRLDELSEEWVNCTWDNGFLWYEKPPAEYLVFLDSVDVRLLLQETRVVVRNWLGEVSTERQESEVSWQTLTGLNVNARGLLAVLGYVIRAGQSIESDEEQRMACVEASSLYFLLLAVPGSTAFNVFHANLYQKAIETLKLAEYLVPEEKKRKKSMLLQELEVHEERDDHLLTPAEKIALTNGLNNIICDFLLMIQSFWFKEHGRSLDVTIRMLFEAAKVESPLQRSNGNVSVAVLSHSAYSAMESLCDSRHGSTGTTITLVVKYVLLRLSVSQADVHSKTAGNIRESTISFLKHLSDVYEKETEAAIVTLIQHLIVQCPERLEARQKQALVFIKLLSICKETTVVEAFRNVILLSHHTRIPCRIFAQEIIAKLLTDFLPVCNLVESLKLKLKKLLITTALSRCMDSSSMVRGKATATFAEFTDSSGDLDKEILNHMFQADSNKTILTEFAELRLALTTENVDPLPGPAAIIDMLMERIEDERVVVRRNALHILKNAMIMFPSLRHKITPVMGRRCRDPAQSVRRLAVQVLSQALTTFPDDPSLLHEWTRSVMPQIFDVDGKVQEKVLEHVQDMLLDRINNASVHENDAARKLPWKILNKLTQMRMRRHLSKVCSLWVKHGVVKKAAITNVQSHINTKNNTPAWVFLASLAENMTLPNMDRYVGDYETLLQRNDFQTGLVLEVVKNSWSSLNQKTLHSLSEHLYDRLCHFEISFGLISICMDIVNCVTKTLHKDSNLIEKRMTNLTRTCEQEMSKILEEEEKPRLTRTVPNLSRVICTLGHAAFACTVRISSTSLRILEGILLGWETLPKPVKEIKELRASAVIVLGQQAIRDREIAQEVAPIFGCLLRRETNRNSMTETAIKINVAKALADICIRFTSVVEPYLSDMCLTMKDSNPLLRETVIVIFIQLLLEDFVKLKGPFFFHILTMLSDRDAMIRELTVFLIEERLLTKNKTLISQQFLESIYHYNNYEPRKSSERKMREIEKQMLTFPGRKNHKKRRMIYDFMLEHLDPPGRIKVLVKLTSQILDGVCNDTIDVKTEEGACILRDALYVISNERLQPPSSTSRTDDDSPETDENITTANTSSSQAMNVIIQGMKRHRIEVLLPVLIKLREKLSAVKSPLEKCVEMFLVKTYFDYSKEQLTKLLNEYPELEKEMNRYQRKSGRNAFCLDNENSSGDDSSSELRSVESSRKDTRETLVKNPVVVLSRLTPTSLSNRRETSEASLNNWSLISNSEISRVRAPPRFSELQDLTSFEPGPSTSTPKSNCPGKTKKFVRFIDKQFSRAEKRQRHPSAEVG